MSDVFVSYKAEDRRRVKSLVEALHADGLSVWWDAHIGAGDEWRETIERQLESARCVVVVWSKRSVGPEGRFVRDEAARAQRRGVYVPVLIDAVEPPLGFGESQATSLRGWRGDRSDPRYQTILSSVHRIAETEANAAAAQPDQPQAAVSRRAVLAAGGVAVIALAGVGGWLWSTGGAGTKSDSIAVLPFANLSGDPAQAYFSDGIAEELRSTLARLAGLQVVGRISSEAVRDEDAEAAARKLGVENILTGSVRQSPSKIRVTAQLVDGHTGIEKWSNSYDRPPGDAIEIQSDIAANVASVLSSALGKTARAAFAVGGTTNAEAQRLVLQASEASRDGNEAGVERALQLVERAIQLDPSYADAYARRARYLTLRTNYYETDSTQFARGRTEALRMAKKAIELAPRLPSAHLAIATIYNSSFQLGPALAELQRALELGPGDVSVLRGYSSFLGQLGRFPEALQAVDKAIAADPLNSAAYNTRVRILFWARRYRDVIEYVQHLPPHYVDEQELLARSFMMAGETDEARRRYAEAPEDLLRRTYEAVLAARTGDHERATAILSRIQEEAGDSASYQYAQIYAQLGQAEQALAALERAWQIRDPGLLGILVDPILDPIRDDSRFEAIVRRVNFPA